MKKFLFLLTAACAALNAAEPVNLALGKKVIYAVAPEERPQLVLPGPDFVYAPAVEGADAGFVYVLIEGNAVGKVPVVYGQTVEQETIQKRSLLDRLFGEGH